MCSSSPIWLICFAWIDLQLKSFQFERQCTTFQIMHMWNIIYKSGISIQPFVIRLFGFHRLDNFQWEIDITNCCIRIALFNYNIIMQFTIYDTILCVLSNSISKFKVDIVLSLHLHGSFTLYWIILCLDSRVYLLWRMVSSRSFEFGFLSFDCIVFNSTLVSRKHWNPMTNIVKCD